MTESQGIPRPTRFQERGTISTLSRRTVPCSRQRAATSISCSSGRHPELRSFNLANIDGYANNVASLERLWQQGGEPCLAGLDPQPAQIPAVKLKQVEGAEPGSMIVTLDRSRAKTASLVSSLTIASPRGKSAPTAPLQPPRPIMSDQGRPAEYMTFC